MELRNRLDQIKIDLAAYYASDFTNAEDDTRENQSLKSRMREVIFAAYDQHEHELFNDAFDVLSKSTGCAEDYAIFVEITDVLVDKNMITLDRFRELLHGSPCNRWL
ncbi:hypothetical protein F2P45_23810 [Massilia sp. CCM 8733]|uniref:MafI family immunity protein n=1 Tax=Massilia mucilaginosa TaxID=2609282 RepID=A0ABX0NZ08_9BURK|nr:hypothetical protein [Massilia mucilaginosa]NHZ92008.1 hypothetical protein [Massilia mucilaginosa]